MSPDTEPTGVAPEPFRHTVRVAEGPNASGYDDLVRAAHASADATAATDAEPADESAAEEG